MQQQIKCFCETLHRKSFPSLVRLAHDYLNLTEKEAINTGKKQLCSRFALLLGRDLLPLRIKSNIIEELTRAPYEADELDKMSYQPSSSEVCKPLFADYQEDIKDPLGPTRPLLPVFLDPFSANVIQDFIQLTLPSKRAQAKEAVDVQSRQPFVNFDSLLQLRGGKNPFTNEKLDSDRVQFRVNEEKRDAVLQQLQKEWGYLYQPPLFRVTPDVLEKVRKAWNQAQQYESPGFTEASFPGGTLGTPFNPIQISDEPRSEPPEERPSVDLQSLLLRIYSRERKRRRRGNRQVERNYIERNRIEID